MIYRPCRRCGVASPDGCWCAPLRCMQVGATGHHMRDQVRRPNHYTSHPSGIECKQIAGCHNFNVGNAIKYLWRQGLKGSKADQLTDLRKAREYIRFEIERLGGKA